eukprot:300224_1
MISGIREPTKDIPTRTVGLLPHEISEAVKHMQEVQEAASSIQCPVTIEARLYSGKTENVCANEKVLHFIRHGEGSHNVHGAEWKKAKKLGNAYTNENCPIDARLTEKGWAQARSIAPALKAVCTERDQLVLTSPLRRAIQTATAAGDQLTGARYISHEALHEQGGLHRCDKRVDRSELIAQFPHVAFEAIIHESDPLWGDGNHETKLSNSQVSAFLTYFLSFFIPREHTRA